MRVTISGSLLMVHIVEGKEEIEHRHPDTAPVPVPKHRYYYKCMTSAATDKSPGGIGDHPFWYHFSKPDHPSLRDRFEAGILEDYIPLHDDVPEIEVG